MSRIEIHWDDHQEAATWNRLVSAVPQSNLLQSWAYGQAKASTENLSVRRGVIRVDGREAAFVQILERRVAGLLSAARINRGPLWLRAPDPALLAETYQALRSLARWWTGRGLLIAPEIIDSDESREMMKRLGYRQRLVPAWRSAWIDLRRPLADLRAALDGKWRNMLSAAERHGLEVAADTSDTAFAWIMTEYRSLMAQRDFRGPHPRLLAAIRTAVESPDDALVLRVQHEGKWIAGISVIRHGAAATYTTGWASDTGRRLRATNLLLWHAIEILAARQVHWLDLGGIDDTLTPGVAAFKRGLGGSEYSLLGEYYSF